MSDFVPVEVTGNELSGEFDGNGERLRSAVLTLRDNIGKSYLILAGVLHNIQEESLFLDWGFPSFADYVESEVRFQVRKAQYLTAIWRKFIVELELPYKDMERIGWSKAKELLHVVNEKNVAKVIETANDTTVDDLRSAVRSKKGDVAEKMGLDPNDGGGEAIERLTITLVGDQIENVGKALDKAKRVSGSDKKNNLIDLVCLDYNAGDEVTDLAVLLHRAERTYGVQIVAFDGDGVVYGADTLSELAEE